MRVTETITREEALSLSFADRFVSKLKGPVIFPMHETRKIEVSERDIARLSVKNTLINNILAQKDRLFTKSPHLFISRAKRIQCTFSRSTSSKYILMLSYHLSQILPDGYFCSGFPFKRL
jgi:hypothetical protein